MKTVPKWKSIKITKSNLVKDVNSKWSKFDIVIYSPAITMGISFDIIDYFENIYMYLCD